MARSKIPNPLERRHQIERDLSAAQALQLAEAYLAEGRSVEAVDFLVKAKATERLEALCRDAVADGDAFLFRAASAAGGISVDRDQWSALADAAEAKGKERYVAEARRQAQRGGD